MSAGATGRNGRVDPGGFYGVKTPFTADATLTSAQSGLVCYNDGATGPVTLTAPASPVIGDSFTLYRLSSFAYPFRFKPGSGHRVEGEAIDKYVELQGPGYLVFEYTRAGVWTIAEDVCLWNPEP